MTKKFGALLSLIFYLFFILAPISHAESIEEDFVAPKRVLLISSYSPSFHTFFQQIDGIKEVFDGYNIIFDVEFMDTKRLFTEDNIINFYNSLTYKLSSLDPYDLVLVSDDNALNFITQYQFELFPDTPIVFFGINNVENAYAASHDPMVTEVIEAPSFRDTIVVASRLQPDATRVLALVDSTPSGQGDLTSFMAIADTLPELTFEAIDLSNLTFDDYAIALEALTDNDIAVLLSIYVDSTGERISFDEGLDLTLRHSPIPVYHAYPHGIGEGLAGGRVISQFEQGRSAASIGLEILQGKAPSAIPLITESPNPFIYDQRVLDAYDLPVYQLPINAQIIGHTPSLLERYSILIWSVILALFIQSIIILMLNRANKARTKAELELTESHNQLSDSHTELQKTNEELTMTNEALTSTYEELEAQNRKIHNLIYVDSLTGLNNRLAVTESIRGLLASETDQKNLILFVDVDNFKEINDTFGHDFGDLVIQGTGRKLSTLASEDMIIGRFGGDEFLILLKNLPSLEDIDHYAAKIQDLFRKPIMIEGKLIYLTVSIGIVLHPRHGNDENELIKRADMALYEAKGRGKNRYVVYDNSMTFALEDKVEFQSELKKAIANQDFHLNFQPIVKATDGSVIAFEALIRWNHLTYGPVSPYKLIRNAEELGLIVEVGDFVLREACRFIKKVHGLGHTHMRVSVNVSPMQLVYDDFFKRIMNIMKEEGCNPKMVYFEMTETTLIKSMDTTLGTLTALRDEGYDIALDDFGSGYSSLRYFRDLPITILKIDRAFIKNIDQSSYNSRFIASIIGIAKDKGIPTVAEGVERPEEREVVRELACDYIQGYYFSRPLPEAEALDYIKE